MKVYTVLIYSSCGHDVLGTFSSFEKAKNAIINGSFMTYQTLTPSVYRTKINEVYYAIINDRVPHEEPLNVVIQEWDLDIPISLDEIVILK